MQPSHIIKSSFSCNGANAATEQAAFADYQRILALLAEVSAQPGLEVAFDIQMRVGSSSGEHPPLPASPPPELADDDVEPTCDICGDLPEWVEMDTERGICHNCADHLDEGLDYYTEEFAHASLYGKDALSLLVLRQRADNCRDTIALEAGSYDGYLEMHEASLEEELLNKRAAECLARLPASFAPWWKDTWTHEKWCEMGKARDATGWPVEKGAPIVQRLAAMFLAEQHKAHELKKAHAEVLANIERARAMFLAEQHKSHELKMAHAEVLANIERARKEDMEAVEARHKREMDKVKAEVTTVVREGFAEAGEAAEKITLDAHRRGYAAGYAFADQKWNPVYKAVCEELAAAQKELSGWAERCVAAQNAAETLRKELKTEVDGATRVFNAMESDLERLRVENKALKEENELLRDLVSHTQKLMVSNPELFGGEARGTSSPKPPPVIYLKEEVKDEYKQRALKHLVASAPPLPKSPSTVLPDIVEVVPSTEGMYMALTEQQYQEMFDDELPPLIPLSTLLSPPIVSDEPTVCGAAGCIDCPPLEPVAEPEAKPKPNYNHPNWPSPITKRFAKHLAKHSGKTDPNTIKTHQDALEYIAKRAKVSVEILLTYPIKHYQTAFEPWTLVQGSSQQFQTGSASKMWWR